MSKSNKLKRDLPKLLRSLADELDRDPALLDRLLPSYPKNTNQDKTGIPEVDPFEVLRTEGESGLRERLKAFDVPSLRFIISRHGLDTTRLAQKWRDKERLISFIIERITARAQKGNVFMAS